MESLSEAIALSSGQCIVARRRMGSKLGLSW